jgi:RNA polymerase sigma-70 factor (ECF subfamily)
MEAARSTPPGPPIMTTLVRDHLAVLEAQAQKLCKNRADAHDLVQDTIERALRYLSSGQTVASERGWLLTILHNQFRKKCQSQRRHPTEPLEAALEPAADEPEPPPAWIEISREQLELAIAELDPRFATVFRLHALDGWDYRQIAAALGIPASTIGTRLLRARKKLRDVLIRQTGAPWQRAGRLHQGPRTRPGSQVMLACIE